jgi:hypothetical protein
MSKLITKIQNLNPKNKKIIVGALFLWSLTLISSGSIMALSKKPVTKTTNKVQFKIVQKQVKSKNIVLKDMSQEINNPLSVNVTDYLKNATTLDPKIIKELKLDTSAVNVTEAGSYTYTITYKEKKYNGTFTITAKPLPDVTLTLKDLNIEVGSTLSTDASTYITETITDEVKAALKIDLTNIDTSKAGSYQYTITYNGKLYTGKVTVYQPQANYELKCTDKEANSLSADALKNDRQLTCSIYNNGTTTGDTVLANEDSKINCKKITDTDTSCDIMWVANYKNKTYYQTITYTIVK